MQRAALTQDSPTRQEATDASVAPMPNPLRCCLTWAVGFITVGYTYLDYWSYSRTSHDGGGAEWDALLAGHSFAPAQYRIGVLRTAALLAHASHTRLRHMFAAIDFVSLSISLALLLIFLGSAEIFRRASRVGQWLQASMALGCFLLYLSWTFWYQKPETHATLLLLVLSAAATRWRRRIPAALTLIVLAALGATVRADAMVGFHAGFLAVCLLPQAVGRQHTLPLGRTVQAVASVLAALAAVGVQFAIMHWLYPQAPRQVAAVQVLSNLRGAQNYLVLLCALFPWWLTLRLIAQRWRTVDGWSLALVLGSVAHFALFYTMGLVAEVRIFLPFAIMLVPVTVTLAGARIEQSVATA